MKFYIILINFSVVSSLLAGAGFSQFPPPPNHSLSPQESNYLNSIKDISNINSLGSGELQSAINGNNVAINSKQSTILAKSLDRLTMLYAQAMSNTVDVADIKAAIPFLTQVQAEKLFNRLKIGDLKGAELLLAALFFDSRGIPFGKNLLTALAKSKAESSQPNSPTQRNTKNTFKGIKNSMKRRYQKGNKSGEWGLDNVYISGDYSYTEFEDTGSNDAGHTHYKSLEVGADLSEFLSLSLSVYHDEYDQRGPNDIFSNEYGFSLASSVHLNENYSVGAFAFYSYTDIENFDPHTYSYGGGLFFATYHRFGDFDISTINSIVKSFTEFDHDTLYVANLRLGYHWTDRLSTGIYGYFIDSMRMKHAAGLDTTYTTFGADITYQLTEQMWVTVGAETVQHLKNYESETFYVNLRYDF